MSSLVCKTKPILNGRPSIAFLFMMAIFFVLIQHCTDRVAMPTVLYRPQVTFKGIINGERVTMEGRAQFPNTCALASDTVKLFMCTSDYFPGNPGAASRGMFMRLSIYPFAPDTQHAQPRTFLGTGDILMHLCIHENTSFTFQIAPRDTFNPGVFFRADIAGLERMHGGRLRLEHCSAAAKMPARALSTMPLEIDSALIDGTIE